MATKPTVLPRFANGGSADVVEPSSGKKDLGWVEGEMPPAPNMNWIHETSYDWFAWLDDMRVRVSFALGFNFVGTDWSVGAFGEVESVNDPAEGSSSWAVPVDIPDGVTYSSARFRVQPQGADGQITCSIVRYVDGAVDSVLGSAVSTTGSSWEDVTVTGTFVNTANSHLLAVIANAAAETGLGVRQATFVELTPA